MKLRTWVVTGLLMSVLAAGPVKALQTTLSPALSYMLMTNGTHGGTYFTNYYYGAHPVNFMKYDLAGITVPSGRTLLVDNASITAVCASGTGSFTDGLWTRNDNFTTTTTWSQRGTRDTLLSTWSFVPWQNPLIITSPAMISYVQSQFDGDKVASFWLEDYNGSGSSSFYHNYYGPNNPDIDFKLNLTYYLMPTDLSNRFADPRFDNVSAQGLPRQWSLWFDNASNTATVDNATYTILPFNRRNALKLNNVTASWSCFSQTISVLGGVPYKLSLTYRVSPGCDVPMCVVISGPNTGSRYLTTSTYGSTTWGVWSTTFSCDVDDNLTVTFYPRGKGTNWFGEVVCKPNVPDTTPTGPVAPMNSDNVTWTQTGGDVYNSWTADNVTKTLSTDGNWCVATVAGGRTYGCLGPVNVAVNKTSAPFLSIEAQQDNQTGGFAVVLDGQPLDLLSYNDETGSSRIDPRDVPGVVTYDLRKFPAVRDNTTVPLQVYVAGTGKQVKFRWLKMANRPQSATLDFYPSRNYLVSVRPPFSTNSYQTLPALGEVDNASNPGLVVTMCRNQTESASFCVYARVPMYVSKLSFTSLTNGTDTIPGSAISARVVKAWYQSGYMGLVAGAKTLVPELLLKNDGLITVNLDNQTNTLNFTGLPTDSTLLQSVNFAAGTTKEFWLTIKAPDNISAGTYTGTVTVTATSAPATTQVPIAVTILPFDLQASGKTTGMFGGYESDTRIQDLADHGINGMVVTLTDYVGVTQSGGNYTYNFDNLTPVITSLVAKGVSSPIVILPAWLTGVGSLYSDLTADPITTQQAAIFNSFLDQVKQYRAQHPGWPAFWIYAIDEPTLGDQRYGRTLNLLPLIHNAGLVGFQTIMDWQTAAGIDSASGAFPDYHPCYTEPLVTDIVNNPAIAHNPATYYPHPNESPVYNQSAFGLRCWYGRLEGFFPWIYMTDTTVNAYNDFYNFWGNRYLGYAYPAASGGVIGTIEWEAVLAGINDLRYLKTLEYYMNLGAGLTGSAIAQLRTDSQNLLNNTPSLIQGKNLAEIAGTVAPEQLQAFRNQIIDKINQWYAALNPPTYTVAELSAMLAAMDSTSGGGNWNPAMDLDHDGEITAADLSILLANLDTQ